MEINPQTDVEEILRSSPDTLVVQFWGVRGTLPVPGQKTVTYGGNTNCVSLQIGRKHFFIFDAGTGIKELSNYLIRNNKLPIHGKIFLTHPHYDHINGIPFFKPLYLSGNEFTFYGTHHGKFDIQLLVSNQMDSVYFPVTIKEFASSFSFHNLKEETFELDDVLISTIELTHPGGSLGYKVQAKGKSFCFITDNELYFENSPRYDGAVVEKLIRFIEATDLLIIDATYTDEEYRQKAGWGHSCISRVVDVVHKAKVKAFCLFHHDPDQYDEDITAKWEQAKTALKKLNSPAICLAPREGDVILL